MEECAELATPYKFLSELYGARALCRFLPRIKRKGRIVWSSASAWRADIPKGIASSNLAPSALFGASPVSSARSKNIYLKNMKTKKLVLTILPEKFGICHFDKKSPVPDWLKGESSFTSLTRTSDEFSIVCPQEKIPGGVMYEKDWRAFKVQGPLGFVLTGIVASLSKPLAKAKISILYISTYETDYLLVEEKNIKIAKKILEKFCEIKE